MKANPSSGPHPVMAYSTTGPWKPNHAEISARSRYAGLCLVGHAMTLAACARLDALRVPDLAITLIAVLASYWFAIRDSRHLASYVMLIWVFSRLVRRLVDWQLGGFESLTALSLLPMMVTMSLAIPTLPRLHRIPRSLAQPLLLLAAPIFVAGCIGVGSYGPAAIIDSSNWLLPILFVPYFAMRQTSPADSRAVMRSIVALVTLSAAYAWYQFLVLPPWDKMWLVQSGMTSSMGRAAPLSVRAWGPMNSTGPAASIWAATIVIAMSDSSKAGLRRPVSLLLCGVALLLSRVRICWISVVVGLLTWSVAQGKRSGKSAVAVAAFLVVLMAVVPLLPGGDLVGARLETFGDLQDDRSFQARSNIARGMVDLVLDNPLGAGLGYGSQNKVAGSLGLAAFDNGVGQVYYTLGLVGGSMWFLGIGLLFVYLRAASKRSDRTARSLAVTAQSLLAMSSVSLLSAYSLAGLSGTLTWLTVGLAISVARTGRTAVASTASYTAAYTGPIP